METKTIGDITTAVIVPRFDAYTAGDVEISLRELLKNTKKLVLDFSHTEYIASAGLRVLLSVAKNLRNSNGQIALSSMKPSWIQIPWQSQPSCLCCRH